MAADVPEGLLPWLMWRLFCSPAAACPRAHLPSSALRSCSLHLGDLCCPLCRLLTEGFISFFLHQLDCGPHCLKLSPRSRCQGPAHPGPVKPSVLMEPDSGLSWPSGWTLRALAKGRASKDCLVVVVGFRGGGCPFIGCHVEGCRRPEVLTSEERHGCPLLPQETHHHCRL